MKPYPKNVQRLATALLTGEGVAKPELRQAAEARAAELGGANREAETLPADLAAYVDKVALHAYQVTDQDIEDLKAAGYCEDEIFEMTLSAALGTGLARVERALSLLTKTGD